MARHMGSNIIIMMLCSALIQSCAPSSQQALASAVSDARRAYACIQIADECAGVLDAETEPAAALALLRECFERVERAGCTQTLEDLAEYLPETVSDVESLKLENDWQ